MSTTAPHPQEITPEGHRRLSAELSRLIAERPRLAGELRRDREDEGDPTQSSSRATMHTAQAALERRIAELESALANAQVVEPRRDGSAGLGSSVTLELDDGDGPIEYTLVGAIEADPAAGRLSVESPIG
ncbi:MAG TPA: GreA/GreB family elongation factor, partial [Solirubrobacteraceae bacterium]|nr:GreA/GreB family elongation factor [Solirubrobacteraceae bacterium]